MNGLFQQLVNWVTHNYILAGVYAIILIILVFKIFKKNK